MKKLFVTALVLLLAIPAFSQVKFGIKAGASTTTVPTYEATGTGTNIEALEDAAWGFHAGVFLRLGIGGLYLQPEVVFNSNTYEYRVQTTTVSEVLDQRFNRLEIPVLVGLKLGPVRLNAGPSATVPIGSPDNLINDPNFDNMYRGTTFGYQAGVGVDIFNTLTLDARYGGSLSKEFGDAVSIGSQTFNLDSRQPQFIISVGIMF
jgi:hypothetical protein